MKLVLTTKELLVVLKSKKLPDMNKAKFDMYVFDEAEGEIPFVFNELNDKALKKAFHNTARFYAKKSKQKKQLEELNTQKTRGEKISDALKLAHQKKPDWFDAGKEFVRAPTSRVDFHKGKNTHPYKYYSEWEKNELDRFFKTRSNHYDNGSLIFRRIKLIASRLNRTPEAVGVYFSTHGYTYTTSSKKYRGTEKFSTHKHLF